jgi:hypothetical protein
LGLESAGCRSVDYRLLGLIISTCWSKTAETKKRKESTCSSIRFLITVPSLLSISSTHSAKPLAKPMGRFSAVRGCKSARPGQLSMCLASAVRSSWPINWWAFELDPTWLHVVRFCRRDGHHGIYVVDRCRVIPQ